MAANTHWPFEHEFDLVTLTRVLVALTVVLLAGAEMASRAENDGQQ